MFCLHILKQSGRLTNTRSPIFSSRSPFFTEPVSDRLDTDSLLARVRLEGVDTPPGVEDPVGVFLAAGVVAGAPVCDGVGDVAREGGAVWVPLLSPSVRASLEGRVKMPRSASH